MRCLFVCFFFMNPKPWYLESRIQLKDSGISLTIGIRNPLSGMESSIPRLSCIQPYMGQRLFQERENNMCERIKRLLGSDYLGKGLNREGGGLKNFLLVKERKNFDP